VEPIAGHDGPGHCSHIDIAVSSEVDVARVVEGDWSEYDFFHLFESINRSHKPPRLLKRERRLKAIWRPSGNGGHSASTD
jgi:hypothetical protein